MVSGRSSSVFRAIGHGMANHHGADSLLISNVSRVGGKLHSGNNWGCGLKKSKFRMSDKEGRERMTK